MLRPPAQSEFQEQIVIIRERKKEREEELHGAWYTEERMKRDLNYSAYLGKAFDETYDGDSKVADPEDRLLLPKVPDPAMQADSCCSFLLIRWPGQGIQI